MMKTMSVVALLVVLMSAACKGGSGSGSGSITVELSPTGSAEALDVTVTATFSEDVGTVAVTEGTFHLKKGGEGASLCTSLSYDAGTKVATCAHELLDPSSGYTITVTGISGLDVDPMTATFTTAAVAPTLESVSKTSVTAEAGGSITITYTFSEALSEAPTLTVVSEATATLDAACELTEDGSAECVVDGISGCKTFTDYTAALSGNMEHEFTFNSADDEFDSPATLDNCWNVSVEAEDGLAEISDGTITISSAGYDNNTDVDKGFPLEQNIASLYYLHEYNRGGGSANAGLRSDPDLYTVLLQSYKETGTGLFGWAFSVSDETGEEDVEEFTLPYGELLPWRETTHPLYLCLVRYDDEIKAYISFDGESFTQVTGDHVECYEGETCDQYTTPGFQSVPAEVGGFKVSNTFFSASSDEGITSISQFGYARFKTSGLTGEGADDCPMM